MKGFSDVPIDDVREYWNRRPCNIRHSRAPIGTLEYFEEVERRKGIVEPHIFGFACYQDWEDADVLEVGCGIGTETIRFLKAGARVIAVDVSDRSIRLARDRAAVYGLEKDVEFCVWNAEHLGAAFNWRAFDLVYSFGVIHHSPHPERIVQGMRAVIKPTGMLKVMVYNRFSWKTFWLTRGRFWRDDLVAKGSEAESGCPVTYTYSKRQIRELLENQGFKVINMRVDHIFPYRIEDYVEYRYVLAWPVRIIPHRIFRWLEKRIGWHLMVTAIPC